jgi:hypothetical protein
MANEPQDEAPVNYAYQYSNANQRVRMNLADRSFWLYEYDALGQAKSGKRYWSDWTPVAGRQFEYGYDDIGNRTGTKAGRDENGWNLRVARLLGERRIPKDSEAGRRQFELAMEQRRGEETGQAWKGLRRGWCFGDPAFRRELLAQMREQVEALPFGEQRQESAEDKANRMVAQALSLAQ